jgi:hypothetical protein
MFVTKGSGKRSMEGLKLLIEAIQVGKILETGNLK